MQTTLNVLIADDEPELRSYLKTIISSEFRELKFNFNEAENGKVAIDLVHGNNYDLILMDVRMPELDGINALKLIKEQNSEVFIVIMTAHSNLKDAVDAIKYGAYDYLEKPVGKENLSEIINKVLEAKKSVQNIALSSPVFNDDDESKFVGNSEKMSSVYDLIYKLSFVETTVLIRGENGTGKELVANAIHKNSPRKKGEFVAVNCGAIPENLMESEMFGHEKGAFTGAHARKIGLFQRANNGTIFLDEIAELPLELQVKLLRVLQEKKFMPVGSNREVPTTARVIAATNRNLELMIEKGLFREDLYYRLNILPIFLPPLRERLDDIQQLVLHFINKFSKEQNKKIHAIEPSAIEAFKNYSWPGNIRELENAIERSFIVENSETIKLDSLPKNILSTDKSNISISLPNHYEGPLDFDQFKASTEREFIVNALKSNSGKINKTVANANIPKNTLLRKIKKYNINVKKL